MRVRKVSTTATLMVGSDSRSRWLQQLLDDQTSIVHGESSCATNALAETNQLQMRLCLPARSSHFNRLCHLRIEFRVLLHGQPVLLVLAQLGQSCKSTHKQTIDRKRNSSLRNLDAQLKHRQTKGKRQKMKDLTLKYRCRSDSWANKRHKCSILLGNLCAADDDT